jgi:hypothetical protein
MRHHLVLTAFFLAAGWGCSRSREGTPGGASGPAAAGARAPIRLRVRPAPAPAAEDSVPSPPRPEIARNPTWDAIQAALAKETDQARLAALERFVNVGMSVNQIDRLIGNHWRFDRTHGPGFTDAIYGEIEEPRLVVRSYPDGEVYAVGYKAEGSPFSVTLRSDDPITWPPTRNDRYWQFRRDKIVAADERDPRIERGTGAGRP